MTIFKGLFKISSSQVTSLSRPAIQVALSTLVFLVMLATASVASATNYWVSTTGSDSNAGTQSAPWRHFSHAAATAVAGDTIIFMDGIYDNEDQISPNSVVNLTTSGTEDAPITFMAQHRGGAILDGGHNGSSTCTGAFTYLNFITASHIVIQGFVIRNSCTAGVWDNDYSTFITTRWNEVYDNGNGTGGDGMYCGSEAHDLIIDGNSIHNNGLVPKINSLDHGLYIECPNITITNNIFYNNTSGWDIQLADNEGVQGVLGTGNVLIANNTFASHNPNQEGQIVVYDAGSSINGLTFQNNIFYNPPMGYAIYGYQANVSNCQINANLISGASGVYTNVGTTRGNGCTIGKNLLNTDPKMVNPAGHNYMLVWGSPAIDAGVILAPVTTDFAQTSRPQGEAYDIGAYEYVHCDRLVDGEYDIGYGICAIR